VLHNVKFTFNVVIVGAVQQSKNILTQCSIPLCVLYTKGVFEYTKIKTGFGLAHSITNPKPVSWLRQNVYG